MGSSFSCHFTAFCFCLFFPYSPSRCSHTSTSTWMIKIAWTHENNCPHQSNWRENVKLCVCVQTLNTSLSSSMNSSMLGGTGLATHLGALATSSAPQFNLSSSAQPAAASASATSVASSRPSRSVEALASVNIFDPCVSLLWGSVWDWIQTHKQLEKRILILMGQYRMCANFQGKPLSVSDKMTRKWWWMKILYLLSCSLWNAWSIWNNVGMTVTCERVWVLSTSGSGKRSGPRKPSLLDWWALSPQNECFQ